MTDFISSNCRAPFLTIIVRLSVVRFVFSVSWPVNLIMCNAAVNSYQAYIYKKRQLCSQKLPSPWKGNRGIQSSQGGSLSVFYIFVEDATVMPCCIMSIASRAKIAMSKTKLKVNECLRLYFVYNRKAQTQYPLACTQPAQQAFPFSFGAKKDRGTRFSALTAQEIKRESKNAPFFAQSSTLVPRSLLRNRTETLAAQAYVHSTLWLRLLFNCNRLWSHQSHFITVHTRTVCIRLHGTQTHGIRQGKFLFAFANVKER